MLIDEEEVGLATAALWLKECVLPLDILHLKLAAKNLADAKDVAFKATNGLPSDEWFRAFVNSMSIKHGINLSLRTPDVPSQLKLQMANLFHLCLSLKALLDYLGQ